LEGESPTEPSRKKLTHLDAFCLEFLHPETGTLLVPSPPQASLSKITHPLPDFKELLLHLLFLIVKADAV